LFDMAKKSTSAGGKSLVIVESPAKARTIGKYLGKNFTVEASIGHIRDLPEGKKEMPSELQKEDWAYLGVNVHKDFEPVYVVSRDKHEQVRKLKGLLKDARELYLATDEDREGEAISWHLTEVLKPKIPVHRMVFHEITAEAIRDALANPRGIDSDLVRAQETRRILDRLYGFDVSSLLWRKLGGIAKSAGRVQSVAVRKVVQRERERIAFREATWWDLLGTFAKQRQENTFQAALVQVDGRDLPSGKDFDPATGKLKDGRPLLLDEQQAGALRDRLLQGKFRVASLEDKPYSSAPYPPFTTSTLQQEGNRKLRFTARRTMQIAQSLYQNGHITYMRTDSTALSSEAIEAARSHIRSEYGQEYLPDQPRLHKNKVRNAQEAHEAIRPAGTRFRVPEELRGEVSEDEFKLYDLIWKRTVASEMENARGRRITLTIEATSTQGEHAVFQVGGKTIDFPGYLRAYVEGSDDPEAELADQEALLPDVQVGEVIDCRGLEPKSHTTQPPARYTEATLTRTLEEDGIGRPSTYATIIDTILQRNYVFKRGAALVPTWTAMAVVKLMEQHLAELVDFQFTARMEDDLDAISRGEAGHTDYLHSFYFGDDKDGLKHQVESKLGEIDVREICRFYVGTPETAAQDGFPPDPNTMEPIHVRVGKFGPFLEQGERRGRLPEDLAPDEVTLEKALEVLQQASQAEEPLGICADTRKPVYLKVGRFGPYVQLGENDDPDKRNASLLRGMSPEQVDINTALKLLSLPRTLGEHPQKGQPVVAQNGRFGPFIKCGDETRSLPADLSPLEVTLEQAVELLAQPKARGRNFRQAREPLKVFEASPVTGQEVKLLDGRYGPYLTDGETNASLPKTVPPADLTFSQALELLADRKAQGPSKKKAARKKASPKKAAATPAVKKKTKTPAAEKTNNRRQPSAAPKKKARRRKTAS
jgi:DNA topoisomerase-1